MATTSAKPTTSQGTAAKGSAHVSARNLIVSSAKALQFVRGVSAKAKSWKRQKMLRDRLKLLKTTGERVHIISCPYENEAGVEVAKSLSQRYEDDEKEFCYYPNEDCPQSLNVSWLETWMAIADNTKRTGGTVFVVHRTDGLGRFGCDAKGPGSLDGQAQPGEVKYAVGIGCTIEWVGYSDINMLEMEC